VVVPDTRREPGVLDRARRRLAPVPCVKAARGDAEHAAHRSYRKHGLMRRYKPEDPLGFVLASLANQAVAFARISRSVLSCLFSRRSRVSSSRSSVVRPSLPGSGLPASMAACATQLRMACAEQPNSAGQLGGVPARSNQLHHLLAKLERIWGMGLGHRGVLSLQGSDVHKSGSTPHAAQPLT
jgi:hypothetical protein